MTSNAKVAAVYASLLPSEQRRTSVENVRDVLDALERGAPRRTDEEVVALFLKATGEDWNAKDAWLLQLFADYMH